MHSVISLLLFIDSLIPLALHDPVLTIRFHLFQTGTLYGNAIKYSKTNSEEALRLAVHAQNHMTLLEGNIRQLTNSKEVPYTDLQALFQQIADNQNALLAGLPKTYESSVLQLRSFESRTESSVKKLYYESLLP